MAPVVITRKGRGSSVVGRQLVVQLLNPFGGSSHRSVLPVFVGKRHLVRCAPFRFEMSLAPGLDVLVQDQLGEWHKAVVLATVSATVSASSSSASIKEEHKEDDRYVLRLARSTRPLPRPVSASRLRRAGDGAPPAPASRPGNIVRVHSGEHAW